MSDKKINLVANIALPLFVMAITITLFFMFRPAEPTALFYLNLGYTVFLEMIFFGYINLLYLKIKEFSTPFLAVFGIYAAYYVMLGLGTMLLYSIVLVHIFPIKFYIAALMILTLLWIIVSVLTAQTDSNYKSTVDTLKGQQYSLEYYAQKINLLASRYEKICSEKGIKYETDSNNRTILDRLKGKISFLTPNVFRSETFISQLNGMLEKCENIVEETEMASEEELHELNKKMQRFVNNSIEELNMLKNMTRK